MPCKSEFSLERFKIVTIFVLEDSRQRSLIFLSQTKSPATKKTGLKQFNPSWCSRKSISINPLPIFGTLHSQSCHSARRELRVKTGLFCCFYATEWRRRTSCELHITSTNRIGPPPAHPPPRANLMPLPKTGFDVNYLHARCFCRSPLASFSSAL